MSEISDLFNSNPDEALRLYGEKVGLLLLEQPDNEIRYRLITECGNLDIPQNKAYAIFNERYDTLIH